MRLCATQKSVAFKSYIHIFIGYLLFLLNAIFNDYTLPQHCYISTLYMTNYVKDVGRQLYHTGAFGPGTVHCKVQLASRQPVRRRTQR